MFRSRLLLSRPTTSSASSSTVVTSVRRVPATSPFTITKTLLSATRPYHANPHMDLDHKPIAQSIKEINSKIEAAKTRAHRSDAVRLVAVSKTKPTQAIEAAYAAGQRHFGENYVQELLEKAPLLPKDIEWHFIGPLQSNKTKKLVELPNLYVVESVHSVKLAEHLNKAAESRQHPLRVMVQVNTSGEDSKSGIPPAECTEFVRKIISEYPRLHFIGLMTIGDPDGPADADFKKLSECKKELVEKLGINAGSVELSMGMSGDYELAVENGSTNVRVGSTIFGARDYGAK